MLTSFKLASLKRLLFISTLTIITVLCFFSYSIKNSLAADLGYGEHLAAECVACHSTAHDAVGIHRLNGMDIDYFKLAIGEYRDGIRSNSAMGSVAASLGEAEVEALAAWFAQLPLE